MTAILAILAICGWIRSRSISDIVQFISGTTHQKTALVSSPRGLVCQTIKPPTHIAALPADRNEFNWYSVPNSTGTETQIAFGPAEGEKQWNFYGISRYEGTILGARFIILTVSYRYVIGSLLMSSVLCLLRYRKQWGEPDTNLSQAIA